MAETMARLAPLGGLDGRRYLDISQPGGVSMRGGYNVEMRDGEWWSRAGRDLVNRTIGSVPWLWIIPDESDTNGRAFLCSPWYALRCRLSDGAVDNIYTPAVTESVTFTAASTSATSSTTRNVHELILVGGGTSFTDDVYRVIAVSGTTITLDRAYEGSNGAVSCRFITALDTPFTGFSGSASAQGGAVIFDQLVSHSGTTLGYANPAVTRGHQYLVIASQYSGATGLIAIDLTSETAPLRSISKMTHLASPTGVLFGAAISVFRNRLVLAGVDPDPDGNYGTRTIWYSQIGDLLLWHTGIQGKTAQANFITLDDGKNPIQCLDTLGPALIAHRKYSQVIINGTDSNARPFQITENRQGYGIANSPQSLVSINDVHYFMTSQGPVRFDGAQVVPLAASLRQHLRAFLDWDLCQLAFDDALAQRIYFVFSADGTEGLRHQSATVPTGETLEVPHPTTTPDYYSVCTVLVYDYMQDAWWLEDHVNIAGAGRIQGRPYTSRYDGTIVNFSIDSGTGFDAATTVAGTDHVVDALCESPWVEFGHQLQKHLVKLHVFLRALDLTTGGNPSVSDYWTLTTQTLHLCTIDILVDGDASTVIASVDCNALVSDMLALTADENQQMPLMVHVKTPTVTGTNFKFRIKNALSSAATTAGHKKAAFRLAGMDAFFEEQTSSDISDPFAG